MTPINDSFVNNLPGLMILNLIIAVPLAFLASNALLHLYRRAVFRSMRIRANTTPSPASPIIVPSLQESASTILNITMLESGSKINDETSTSDLYTSLLRAPWRAMVIYSLAGLGFAIVMTCAYLVSTGTPFLPMIFITVLWIIAWPIIPTVNIVIATTWHTRLSIALGYFILLAALGIVIAMGHPAFGWGKIEHTWLLINLPAILVLTVFLQRRTRAVSPLVLIVMILGVTGANFTFFFVANNMDLFSTFFELNSALGLGRYIVAEVLIAGFIVFGMAGWLILRWIGVQYKKKKLSDQSITIGAIWLVYGVVQSIDLMLENTAWFFAGIPAFAVFTIIAWTGFSMFPHGRPSTRKNPTLLVLRVFSLGKRSERLFDMIGRYWRYIGSIRLIAGPDLLTTTVEPHEFLDFLSGKLARRFIADSQTLDLRLAETDLKPDWDERFRVNDFFCHDDTWRMVLSRLVDASDIVLMDLRGFTLHNAGCIFEIRELFDVMPLHRVVFIIDDTTDEPFLRETIQKSWDSMRSTSPNRLPGSGSLRLLHYKRFGRRDLQHVLHALSLAVDTTMEGQHQPELQKSGT